MLKYGLDELMQNEDSTIVDEDLRAILGMETKPIEIAAPELKPETIDEQASVEEEENIYEYAGEDYSKVWNCMQECYSSAVRLCLEKMTLLLRA